MTEFIDLALTYDPALRHCDLALGTDGDLALDDTPATPMLVSLGSDRRARPDDPVDDAQIGQARLARSGDQAEPLTLRRGWAGDALDAEGRMIGSRLWLLERAKGGELTRRFAEEWAKEALAWALAETGRAATVSAQWLQAGLLALKASVDGRSVTVNRQVSP